MWVDKQCLPAVKQGHQEVAACLPHRSDRDLERCLGVSCQMTAGCWHPSASLTLSPVLQKNKFKEGTTIIFKRVLQQVSA